MTRLGVVFWGGLVLASGFATFNVKYAVQGIDDELARVRRQAAAEQQEIRSLTAEWAYLNQPERLAALNRSFLQLTPMTAKQLQGRIEEIALRAPPAGVPETLFAATLPTAANPPAATSAAASPVPPGAAAPDRAVQAGAIPTTEAKTAEAPAGMTRSADVQGTAPKGAETPAAGTSADGAIALAEAQRLLGIDAGGQSLRARLAKVAPITAAQAAEAPVADAASGGTRPAGASAEGAAALAETLNVLGSDGGGQTPRVRLAKAAPASLDALISKITNTR
jgi:cell division protein FtsL